MNAVILRRQGVDVDAVPASGVVAKGATRVGLSPAEPGGCELWRRMAARAALNRSQAGRYRFHNGYLADQRRGCALTASLKW